jgi:hypothetical protein
MAAGGESRAVAACIPADCSEIGGKLDTNGLVRQGVVWLGCRGNGLTGKWAGDVTRLGMMSAVAEIPRFRRSVGRRGGRGAALLPTTDETMAVVERVFAEQVGTRVHDGIVRYSDRLFLLRAAQRLHIERFRANLIIALVQREGRRGRVVEEAAAPVRTPGRWRIAWAVGIVLLVEAIVVGTLYLAWRV